MKIKIIIITFVIITAIFSGCMEEEKKSEEKTNSEIAIEFMTLILNGNLSGAYDYFSSLMTEQFSYAQFEGTWDYIEETYGELDSIVNTTESVEDGYDIIFINCTFANDYYIIFKIVFEKNKEISGFWTEKISTIAAYSAPEYVDITEFKENKVTIGEYPWELPGTITIPNKEGSFPAVVLVQGSGANDRDETIGPNKPLKDIAWGLATNDIIVLRYDKRTKVYPEETAIDKNLTVKEEVLDDAIEAVKILNKFDNVNTSQIYVLGHSLGAMMAPQIASNEKNISGIILLAAPARKLEDLIYNQTIYLSELDGVVDENESIIINTTKDALKRIKSLNISKDEQVLTVYKAYWEYLNNYNQVKIADSLTIPIMLLQGKRDYQVTYTEDYLIWNNTFSDNSNTYLKTYNKLNHLFFEGEGVPTNTEYLEPGHVSSDVIRDIANWINGEK